MTMKPDITYLTVRHQLNAMNCQEYELGLLDRINDKMICRSFKKNEVLNAVQWFKHKNTQGQDIFIRPKGSIGLIFFDDVSLSILDRMKDDGLEPAIITESSPQNYQGWVRISNQPIEKSLATHCANIIANKYKGDLNSADHRHFGRLAGYCNNKPEHVNSLGKYPFVKLTTRNGRIAEKPEAIIFAAKERAAKFELNAINQVVFKQANSNSDVASVIAYDHYQQLIKQYTDNPEYELNLNAVDWQVATALANAGYTYDVVFECLLSNSPNIDQRKGKGRGAKYVERTLIKLFNL
ncbi:MAG: hypothetical protein HRU24_13230 [Gammaproteobacteria bacterium]|nr:hypothetical protein [Gammaproteobacteria bacterium]